MRRLRYGGQGAFRYPRWERISCIFRDSVSVGSEKVNFGQTTAKFRRVTGGPHHRCIGPCCFQPRTAVWPKKTEGIDNAFCASYCVHTEYRV